MWTRLSFCFRLGWLNWVLKYQLKIKTGANLWNREACSTGEPEELCRGKGTWGFVEGWEALPVLDWLEDISFQKCSPWLAWKRGVLFFPAQGLAVLAFIPCCCFPGGIEHLPETPWDKTWLCFLPGFVCSDHTWLLCKCFHCIPIFQKRHFWTHVSFVLCAVVWHKVAQSSGCALCYWTIFQEKFQDGQQILIFRGLKVVVGPSTAVCARVCRSLESQAPQSCFCHVSNS